MTVSAQTPINRSTGNGVATVFPYTFKIIADADIEVTVDDVVKTLNVDYTVSGAGVDAGGNVTMTTAPANLTTVVRRRNMALVRTTDYQDQGTLPAATLDNDIDATVLMVQQLDERLDRTFSLPASFSGDSTLPDPEAGYLIGWDATGENLTNIPASVGSSLVDIAAPSGSSLVGFTQSGTGAVSTTVQAKLRESVSVHDFGAVGDGVADDTVAIQSALAAFGSSPGTLLFTSSLYLISAPILISLSGMRLVGASPLGCYLLTANAQTFDLMRIAGSNVEVTGFQFRPGNGAQRCLNVYGSRAHIHHNRFLAGNPGSNTAILLTSDDPSAVPVPGAYNHTIEFNEIGLSGFHFALALDQGGSLGQQANNVISNKIVSDLCVKTRTGGGNFYSRNLLQSMTGTVGVPAGNGFDFDSGVVGETVIGNYIERFQYGIISRNNTIYSGGAFGPNHNDNNTNNVFFVTKGNSFYIDSQDGTARWNEWQILPAWNSNWRLKSGFYTNSSIEVKAAVNSVQVNGHGVYAEQRNVNTGEAVIPDVGCIKISGNGSASTGLILQTGYYDGQILYMIGNSWGATFVATNCVFSSAGVPTFGNAGGNVASMTLLYSSGENKWYEMSRVIR